MLTASLPCHKQVCANVGRWEGCGYASGLFYLLVEICTMFVFQNKFNRLSLKDTSGMQKSFLIAQTCSCDKNICKCGDTWKALITLPAVLKVHFWYSFLWMKINTWLSCLVTEMQ